MPKTRSSTKTDANNNQQSILHEDLSVPALPIRNVEEIRAKNLESNRIFLESLLLTKLRDDFKDISNSLQPKKEPKKRQYLMVTEQQPVRRSKRLLHMDPAGNKLPSPEVSENEDENNGSGLVQSYEMVPTTIRRKSYKRIEPLTEEQQEVVNNRIKTIFSTIENHQDSTKILYDYSDMELLEENVLKLTPDRLIQMDIHPSSNLTAIIGCDRKGATGLLVKSVNDELWSKVNYIFHKAYATCIRFDRLNPNLFYSSSYDGTFRLYDISTNTSDEVYRVPDGNGITCFDYVSDNTFLATMENGDAIMMDFRSSPIVVHRYDLSKTRLRTIHVNPCQPNEFCVAGRESAVRIFDVRQLVEDTRSSFIYCLSTNRACYGAYYNHLGTYIMATTTDDHLASFKYSDFSSAASTADIDPTHRVSHQNYVNRFVTPFCAMPHPIHADQFLIGSSRRERQIHVVGVDCKVSSSLESVNLNSLCSVNIAHRTQPIVVGGNSSGRIHVFTKR